jgi:membrane associated rhomboid family serine protease
MIILIPIGHDELEVSRLPFATFALMAICIVVFAVSISALDESLEDEERALARVRGFYQGHPYLELDPDTLGDLPAGDQGLYELRQEWLEWYAESPDEAAELLEGTPITHREGVVTVLDDSGEVVQVPEGEPARVRLDEETLLSMKAELIGQVSRLDSELRYEEQQTLDELCERYESIRDSSVARRFAYVPADPSAIGLVTHIFLHGGVLHLVFNLVFLWIAAVKLEDLWGRPLFVGAFVVFGVIAALVHGLLHSGSSVPMVGASGAVAGLMGAFLVRLARTEIKFVYAYWIFRPGAGSFQAPAYVMLPLWFAGELTNALFFDIGFVAYWAHVGGFVAGVATALAFRLTDFERRVLKREPDIVVDVDTSPLVAFQQPTTDGVKSDLRPESLEIEEAAIERLDAERLLMSNEQGAPIELRRDDVTVLAAAQVMRIGGPAADAWFAPGKSPPEPAVLLVLMCRPRGPGARAAGYVIDGAKLRYNRFMANPLPLPRDSFFALLKQLFALFPGARFAGDRVSLAAGELPQFATLDELAARLARPGR